MKCVIKNNIALLFVLGCSFSVYAHDFSGTLNDAVSATDYYLVQCSDDGGGTPTDLYFQLSGIGSIDSPLVSAQIIVGNYATTVTDPVTGDVEASRAVDIPVSGNGNYYLAVDKNKRGTVGYEFIYHCISNGTHTGTDIFTLQNQ